MTTSKTEKLTDNTSESRLIRNIARNTFDSVKTEKLKIVKQKILQHLVWKVKTENVTMNTSLWNQLKRKSWQYLKQKMWQHFLCIVQTENVTMNTSDNSWTESWQIPVLYILKQQLKLKSDKRFTPVNQKSCSASSLTTHCPAFCDLVFFLEI